MSNETPDRTEIVARAGRYYRNTRFLMVFILIAYGAWSLHDGFVVYPRENAEAAQKGLEKVPHPGLDVPFNQWLGMFLPPLGIAFLVWTLYNSRGQYRYANRTLSVPGHPPVPVDAMRKIDKTRWDRKGIAYVDYQLPNAKGSLRLDDFIYEREPTDAIVEAIEKDMVTAVAPPPVRPAPSATPPRPPRQQIR